MRILITLHDFLPFSRAGTELYAYYLAQQLQSSGIEVELFFAEPAPTRHVEQRMYEGLSCTVVRKPVKTFENLFEERDPWVDQVFVKCLERLQPDVVHINHLLHLSTSIPKIAKQYGALVVLTMHDYWLSCPRLTLLDSGERLCESTTTMKCTRCCRELYARYRIYRSRAGVRGVMDATKSAAKTAYWALFERGWAYRQMRSREHGMTSLREYVDAWIAPSQFLRDIVAKWGVPRDSVLVIPYGLRKKGFSHVHGRGSNRRLQFGYVGTISRPKGVHILLEAFRGLAGGDLLIYGRRVPGFYSNYGDVLAQGNVHIQGVITDEEKADAYAGMDALIVPSIWFENAPLTIQEAFSAGVPVICSDIGGMKELVQPGANGLHFRAGSSDDLRRVLRSCIEDPTRLQALQARPESVLSIEDHVAAQLLPLYRRLVNVSAVGGEEISGGGSR